MTHVQDLAWAYGRGETSAATVVAVARAAAVPPRTPAAEGYEALMARMQTDDGPTYNTEGWDGVTSVYVSGGLTAGQYEVLHDLYLR